MSNQVSRREEGIDYVSSNQSQCSDSMSLGVGSEKERKNISGKCEATAEQVGNNIAIYGTAISLGILLFLEVLKLLK